MSNAQQFIIFNPLTMRQLAKVNGDIGAMTQAVAKRVLTSAVKKGRITAHEYLIGTVQEFHSLDRMVEVKNLMSGKMCNIRLSNKGGCCDPSTETYWSM